MQIKKEECISELIKAVLMNKKTTIKFLNKTGCMKNIFLFLVPILRLSYGWQFWILFLAVLSLPKNAFSQNVGIGTTTPAFKLDIKNGSINTDSVYRIGGYTFLSARAGNILLGAGDGNGLNFGIFNIAIGLAQEGVVNGSHNIGMGFNALDNNAAGNDNIAIGSRALEYNTASNNIAIGKDALAFNTTPAFLTAIGYKALNSNITGVKNTALGTSALTQNVAGGENTAVGYNALKANTRWNNTAMGSEALGANTIGDYNSALGSRALQQNTTGERNTAIGAYTLNNNTTGSSNTGLGFQALGGNGSYNTAVGDFALFWNQTASSNTALGAKALYFTEGSHNTGIGANALYSTVNAEFNTAVGFNAGANFASGWNNTFIGAQADLSFNGQFNAIAIGNLATPTDNSKVRIGNSANWSYEAFANWTNISDGLYKKNIKENVAGLSFILKLRPVTYNLDVSALSKKFKEERIEGRDAFMKKAIAEKEQMLWTGFVAQEVEVAATSADFNFSGVDKPRNKQGVYGLRYAEFVVPLVKAVQEQQLMIEELKKQNELLLKRIEVLENKKN